MSHMLIGAALLGGRTPRKMWAAAAGALLPDLPLIAVHIAALVKAVPAALIFMVLYFQNGWQITLAITHNFWLWCGLLAFIFVMMRRSTLSDRWSIAFAFAASGLLHSAVDFLTQREDAHMQFWPATRWLFISPVSYRDPAHFGTIFGVFEILMGASLALILFQRFSSAFVRILLIGALASYAWSAVRLAQLAFA